MGVEPPFIYDPPSRYSFVGPNEKGFNPKAVSQASLSPPRSRPKQDGPLINAKEFNRHPDSYFVVPYGNLDWKPMSPSTKNNVKYTRWIQLFLRICALLGAAGMLMCVICIKGTQASVGWIIRVPPGVAILHTVYAIYHLARSSKARTPASSASYMLFAAIIDTGLLPFFILTALMARSEYTEPSNTQGRWQTLFGSDTANYKILFSTFLLSLVNGVLHLISLVISIYLAITFRKISKLPPDMNPLEDNLTSRHKRNKSSLLDNPAIGAAKNANRDSRADDPLISPPRTVPFLHTRNDSSTSLSKAQPDLSSPHISHFDIPVPPSEYASSQRSSRARNPPSPALRSPQKRTSFYTDNSRPSSVRPPSTRPPSSQPPASRTHSFVSSQDTSNNWITYPSPPNSPPPLPELKHLRPAPRDHATVQQNRPWNLENVVPRPLEMNPPTPPIFPRTTEQRPLAPGTGNGGLRSMSRPVNTKQDSFGVVGGKARFYGDMGRGRVVSRSGAEVRREEGEGVRVREVSGKVVEEGRGRGWGGWRDVVV